jgi:hypothetical protein
VEQGQGVILNAIIYSKLNYNRPSSIDTMKADVLKNASLGGEKDTICLTPGRPSDFSRTVR